MNKKNPYLSNGDLVSFLGVGAQKSGTTALFYYLQQHPSLVIPKNEVHFFDKEAGYIKGVSQYHQFFKNLEHHQIAGEMTPSYMYRRHCAQRIWKYNPNMRLIFILRNPVERAISQWNMWCRNPLIENSDINFIDLVFPEHHALPEIRKSKRKVQFLNRGLYSEQIRNMLCYFPMDQMLFIKNEDMRRNLNETLEKVCTFLEISSFDTAPKNMMIFSFPHKYESIQKKDRELLINFFEPSVKELERLIDWDCSDWLRE